MSKRKLCILICGAGLSFGTYLVEPSAASAKDDQDQALQALRQAEAGAPTNQPAATPKKAKKKKKAAEAATSVPVATADDQTKALEALRQAEAGPVVPDAIAPETAAPAAIVTPSAPVAPAAPVTPAAPVVPVEPSPPAAPAIATPAVP